MSHVPAAARWMVVWLGCLAFGFPIGGRASGIFYDSIPWVSAREPLWADPAYVLPKISTLGEGVEYRHRISSSFGIRAESLKLDENRSKAGRDVNSLLRMKMRSNGLLFDWFPFEGRFRTTVGIYFNREDVSGTMSYDDLLWNGMSFSAVNINDFAQKASQTLRTEGYTDYADRLDQFAASNSGSVALSSVVGSPSDLIGVAGRVHLRSYAPYLGIGWTNLPQKRTGFFYTADIGIIDLGRPRVEYFLTGQVADAVRSGYGSQIDVLLSEEARRTEEQLIRYRYFPVVSLGLSYRF